MESVYSPFLKKAGSSILLKMNSLSGLIHRAPHTVHTALKLRTPLQIHKTALLALELHEACKCSDLRRTRVAWSLIEAICHLVTFNVLCRFSCRRTHAVEPQFHGVPHSSITKPLDVRGYADSRKGGYFSLDIFVFEIPEAGGKSPTLQRSMRSLTAMFCPQQIASNEYETFCVTNLVIYEWQRVFSSLFLIVFFYRFIGFTPANVSDPVRWWP
jgi:hypothetical protein